jgi:hypothetical protein
MVYGAEAGDFEAILDKTEAPLVVWAQGGVFKTRYDYLTAYKGLIFYARTPIPLTLPPKAELINAKKIWVPG